MELKNLFHFPMPLFDSLSSSWNGSRQRGRVSWACTAMKGKEQLWNLTPCTVRSSNTGNVWYKLHVLCFTSLSLEISSCLEVTAL